MRILVISQTLYSHYIAVIKNIKPIIEQPTIRPSILEDPELELEPEPEYEPDLEEPLPFLRFLLEGEENWRFWLDNDSEEYDSLIGRVKRKRGAEIVSCKKRPIYIDTKMNSMITIIYIILFNAGIKEYCLKSIGKINLIKTKA